MQADRSSPGFWAEVVTKKVNRRNIVFETLAKLGRESNGLGWLASKSLVSHNCAQLTEF